MKEALVFYLWGNRNAGDMAISLGAISLLKRNGYHITMVSRFSESEAEYRRSKEYLREYYPDVVVYPGPFSFDRNFTTTKKMFSYIKSFLIVCGVLQDKNTKELIHNADKIFFNGGNLLRGTNVTDYLRLIALFYPILIARKQGFTSICLPQSAAKISKIGEIMLKKVFVNFDKIYIREKISFFELRKRFADTFFVQATDMAFLCENTQTARIKYEHLQLNNVDKGVAIVVRNTGIGDIGEISKEKQNIVLEKLIKFAKEYKKYKFFIVVQTEKDRNYSNRLYKLLKSIVEVHSVENHDPLVLRELYKNVKFLITMRLHAGILSLSALTPVIGIFSKEWGLKNPGIMNDYKMPYVMIEDINEDYCIMPVDVSKEVIARRIEAKTEPFKNF